MDCYSHEYFFNFHCASPSDSSRLDNQVVFLGKEATFGCLSRDDTALWRVNDIDLPSELFPDLVTDETVSASIYLFALTIPGRAEYNGTRVQCVTGGGERSNTALLEIQGMYDRCLQCHMHGIFHGKCVQKRN